MYANTTADAQIPINCRRFVEPVLGLVGGLELQGVHWTTLDAQGACLAGSRVCAYPIVGGIMALVVFQHMIRIHEQAAAIAAITNGSISCH